MPLLVSEFDNFELFYEPAIPLTKDNIVEYLRTSCPEFMMPESITEIYESSLIHYVRFRYILQNSTDKVVVKIREYLNKKGMSDDLICRCVAKFYKETFGRAHNILKDVSLDEIERGLMANGIQSIDMIEVAVAIFAMMTGQEKELKIWDAQKET